MADAAFKGGKELEKELRKLAKKLSKATTLSVGFLANAKYPDGQQVAMVAAIQNYGAPKRNIKPRPFFTKMVQDKSPGWAMRLISIWKAADLDSSLALQRMGMSLGSDLQQSIIDTNTPPLDPKTVKRKGFAKPLVDTSHMLNSVQFMVDDSVHSLPPKGGK